MIQWKFYFHCSFFFFEGIFFEENSMFVGKTNIFYCIIHFLFIMTSKLKLNFFLKFYLFEIIWGWLFLFFFFNNFFNSYWKKWIHLIRYSSVLWYFLRIFVKKIIFYWIVNWRNVLHSSWNLSSIICFFFFLLIIIYISSYQTFWIILLTNLLINVLYFFLISSIIHCTNI